MTDELGAMPTPAEETISAPAPDETVNQDAPEPAPEKTFTQAELDEILEKRIARERRKLEKLERQQDVEAEVQRRLAAMQAAQNPASNGPPKREDFESYEEYLEARADWKVEQKLSEAESARQEREVQRQAQERQAKLIDTWQERAAKAAEKYPDFDEVVRSDDVAISDAMAIAIRQAENGTDLAYYLGKNPEESRRIFHLDPAMQIYELGRISATVGQQTKPVSKATPPVEPVTGGRSGSRNDLYEPGISTEEYIRRRRAQEKRAG